MRRSVILTLAVALPVLAAESLPVPHFADPARRSKLEKSFPEADRIFESYFQRNGVPGLVYGIVIDQDIVHIKTFGVRDRDTKDPVTADTVFRIASMTKSFTAAALLKLRDEGKLSLEDPVSKWIPEFATLEYPTRDTAPIRVRQLVSHNAGFPEDNPWGDRQLAVSDDTLTEWLKKGLPFSTPPGTEYEYSNYGFALAGRVVAKASGMPYDQYIAKAILGPLGLTASTLEASAVPPGRLAVGYGRSGQDYFVIPSLKHGAFGAMGGMMTSARDLGRYVAWHLAAWPPRDEDDPGPVRRSSRREMQQLQRSGDLLVDRPAAGAPLRAESDGYGFGLSIGQDCRFGHIVDHGGGLPGFGSFMMWLPDYGVGLFAMTNLTYSGPRQPMNEVLDVMLKTGGLQKRVLAPSPVVLSARDAIVRLVNRWNESEASALAADNFFQDRSAEKRRHDLEAMHKDVGECRATDRIEPLNLLRATFRLSCEHGDIAVFFSLAPTMPPKLQRLNLTVVKPLDEKVKRVAQELAAQVGSGKGPWKDRHQMDTLRVSYGSCRLGETRSGDGKTNAVVRFDCDRGPLDVRLALNGDGKIRTVFFQRAAGTNCVP